MTAEVGPGEDDETEPLVIVPVPALCVVLLTLEKQLVRPLTEPEVLEALDKAACTVMPLSVWKLVEESRGYRDMDPENVWLEWQALRPSLHAVAAEPVDKQD